MPKYRVIPHVVYAEYNPERKMWSVSRPDGFTDEVDPALFRERYAPESPSARDLFIEVYGDASWGFDHTSTSTKQQELST